MLLLASLNVSAQSTVKGKEQCTALTSKGVQCKNTAKAGEATCTIHSANTPRCGATTSKGQPCKMIVHATGDKCFRHKQ